MKVCTSVQVATKLQRIDLPAIASSGEADVVAVQEKQ